MQFRFDRKRTARIAVLMLALAFAHTAHAADYKVMDSGVVLGGTMSIQWMDNNRVLFTGATNDNCRNDNTSTNQNTWLPHLAEFDTRSGKVTWHGNAIITWLCYSDRQVSYLRQVASNGLCPTGKREHLSGEWGKERVHEEVAVDRGSCKPVPKSVVEANDAWAKKTTAEALEKDKKKLRMIRLREEHGWLAMRDATPRYPVAIYPPGREDSPIPIDQTQFAPWSAKKIDIDFVRYETFKGAYLLALEDFGGLGRDHGMLWWLYPNGKLEHLLTYSREREWKFFNYLSMVPTRKGFLMMGGQGSDRTGLYRHTESGRLELIERGFIGEPTSTSLSPDGCKLAYGIHTKGFGHWPAAYRLHVIDVCTNVKR